MADYLEKLEGVLGFCPRFNKSVYMLPAGEYSFEAELPLDGKRYPIIVNASIDESFIDDPSKYGIVSVISRISRRKIPYESWREHQDYLWEQWDYPSKTMFYKING